MTGKDDFRDHYKTLGVPPTATDDEIKERFRKLMSQFHPDSSSEDNVDERLMRAQAVGEAYAALGSGGRRKEVRANYDREYEVHAQKGYKTEGGSGIPSTSSPRQSTVEDVLQEALNNIFKSYTVSSTRSGGPTRSRAADVFNIPENDLGLLAALTTAYKSKEAGKWRVMRSENDKREWMPECIYSVQRDEKGNVVVFRQIKDWRDKYDRDREIKIKNDRSSWETDGELTQKADALLGESILSGPDSYRVEGSFWPEYGFAEHLAALKSIARKFAEDPKDNGNYDLAAELSLINRYMNSSTRIRMENEPPYSFGEEREVGRIIPFDKFWGEMRTAEGRVLRVVPSQGKEGQHEPPKQEGGHPQSDSGEILS